VDPQHQGERLDRFLAAIQTDLSRSRLQALIRDGLVLVNGRAGRVSQRLKPGDSVSVEVPERITDVLEAEAIPLTIVHEDDSLIVIDKPAGLVVHPGAGVPRGTLVHALLHHFPAIAGVGGAVRPGIVHRLDRDTSGLMVVAKTERAHRALVAMIAARRVRRTYRAIVWGVPRFREGVVDAAIGRDPKRRQRMSVVKTGGRPARSRYRVLESLRVATSLEVTLETGRTHQIRVHLSHLGHPVVGDPLYGGRPKKQLSAAGVERSLAAALLHRLNRQALHASELEFAHPVTGETLHFRSRLPDDMAAALEALRSPPTG